MSAEFMLGTLFGLLLLPLILVAARILTREEWEDDQ